MNPLLLLPPVVRQVVYVLCGLAQIVVVYMASSGRATANDVALVTSIVSFFGFSTALSHVPPKAAVDTSVNPLSGIPLDVGVVTPNDGPVEPPATPRAG